MSDAIVTALLYIHPADYGFYLTVKLQQQQKVDQIAINRNKLQENITVLPSQIKDLFRLLFSKSR